MLRFWRRAPREDRVAHTVLQKLSRKLTKEYQLQISTLSCLAWDSRRLETLFGPLKFTAQARAKIALVLEKSWDGQAGQPAALLAELAEAVTERLGAEPGENLYARQALSRVLGQLLASQEAMLPTMQPISARPALGEKRRVLVTQDLLHQCYNSLFPAERMLVVSGRRIGDTTRLADMFDVTGDQSGGHVRANPVLLQQALIQMDQSDAFLAAWLHSHPGFGPGATQPSPIDLGQERDWLQDYPNLLNLIVVEDRWVRFWGTKLESDRIEVEILGRGVITENKHGNVYRLGEQR
jgi:hypothetical protein